jgi:AcrR family transcriptional regulator
VNKRSAKESKRLILAAAQSVFAERGYTRASIRDIARVAGISVGGLYLYFKNKEELYQTFMQDWMNNLDDRTHEALSMLSEPVEAIKAFISISLNFARTHKEMFILQEREWGFSLGVDELERDFFLERRKTIADIVRKGMEMGLFRPGDADGTAKVIFNILRGFAVSMVIDEDALFLAEDCVSLVLHGLLKGDAG